MTTNSFSRLILYSWEEKRKPSVEVSECEPKMRDDYEARRIRNRVFDFGRSSQREFFWFTRIKTRNDGVGVGTLEPRGSAPRDTSRVFVFSDQYTEFKNGRKQTVRIRSGVGILRSDFRRRM